MYIITNKLRLPTLAEKNKEHLSMKRCLVPKQIKYVCVALQGIQINLLAFKQ